MNTFLAFVVSVGFSLKDAHAVPVVYNNKVCDTSVFGHYNKVTFSNHDVTLPEDSPYFFISTSPDSEVEQLAEGSVKKVYPASDQQGNLYIIGIPKCAFSDRCSGDIAEVFRRELLLGTHLIGSSGIFVDLIESVEGHSLLVKEYVAGSTVKQLLSEADYDDATRIINLGGMTFSVAELVESLSEMFLNLSYRVNDQQRSFNKILEKAGISDDFSESQGLAMRFKDINPSNLIITKNGSGKIQVKVIDAYPKILGIATPDSVENALKRNTWEFIRALEGSKALGLLPDSVVDLSHRFVPGWDNYPPVQGNRLHLINRIGVQVIQKMRRLISDIQNSRNIPGQ